jgi:hypothetical protein
MTNKAKEPETPTNPINDLLKAMQSTGDDSDEFVPTTDVELTHEIVQTLFDEDKLNMITSLSRKELSGVVKIYTVNDVIHDGHESVLTRMIHNYLTLKISDNRLGRKELIQAIIGRQPDEVSNGGLINRFIH